MINKCGFSGETSMQLGGKSRILVMIDFAVGTSSFSSQGSALHAMFDVRTKSADRTCSLLYSIFHGTDG